MPGENFLAILLDCDASSTVTSPRYCLPADSAWRSSHQEFFTTQGRPITTNREMVSTLTLILTFIVGGHLIPIASS